MTTPPDDGLIRINERTRRVWLGAREIDLTRKCFDLLARLMAARGEVVTRRELLRDIWDLGEWSSTKSLDMHVSVLRKAVGDVDMTKVRTVRGVGLILETWAVAKIGEPVPTPAEAAERIARELEAMIERYPEDVFTPDGTTPDAIGAAAMRHAYRHAARIARETFPAVTVDA